MSKHSNITHFVIFSSVRRILKFEQVNGSGTDSELDF